MKEIKERKLVDLITALENHLLEFCLFFNKRCTCTSAKISKFKNLYKAAIIKTLIIFTFKLRQHWECL